jgi:hypothetical protein
MLLLLVGALMGGLVIAVSLPDGEDGTWVSSVLERAYCACDDILVELGLRPKRGCVGGQRNACISNLKQIEGAKAIWALENKKTNSDIPATNDLYGATAYIRDEPMCPMGGKYVIGSVQQKIRCSIRGHTF